MNRTRLILLAVAMVTALVAAYLSSVILSRQPEPSAPAPVVVQQNNMVDVLVAAKNVAQGEQLGGFSVEWRAWPRNAVTSQMITKETMPDALDQMPQARARLPFVAGELIVAGKIVRPGDRGFMSAILPQGMRAVAIPIGETTGVSGFVLPNDRVDVLLTRRGGNEGSSVAETVLRNVKVLAINQSMIAENDQATIPAGRTAVLELDPQQSEIVTSLLASGTLTLVLRSLAEGGPAGVADDRPILSDGFLRPRGGTRDAGGTLVIRYGVERKIPSR